MFKTFEFISAITGAKCVFDAVNPADAGYPAWASILVTHVKKRRVLTDDCAIFCAQK